MVELVKEGKISEERIDLSIRRILREKFRMGLFDNSYLDASALSVFEKQEHFTEEREAQRRSTVLLKNEDEIILELIYGQFNPSGKLPLEIPSSVEVVESQF